MVSRLWLMNADFEMEIASRSEPYRRPSSFAKINQRLTRHLLWLTKPGDALLYESPLADELVNDAARRDVELIALEDVSNCAAHNGARIFTPWGWTSSALQIGRRSGAIVPKIELEIIKRVNSKLYSHALEQELGITLPGACATNSFEELEEAVKRACPKADDKWVIKSPFGFAACDRVLGRGSELAGAQATWVRRRLTFGETLIFQPWLDKVREYGVVLEILPDGDLVIHGISDLQTNGAGTGTGYLLGRPTPPHRKRELEEVATFVGKRLFADGYTGAVGVDAIEHTGGLHPLLEINARYTMGFIALAVERALKPTKPIFWSTVT